MNINQVTNRNFGLSTQHPFQVFIYPRLFSHQIKKCAQYKQIYCIGISRSSETLYETFRHVHTQLQRHYLSLGTRSKRQQLRSNIIIIRQLWMYMTSFLHAIRTGKFVPTGSWCLWNIIVA